MECYACDQDATRQCPRCAKDYCPDHGDDLCAQCLDPANAAPSNTVFRASLVAMLVGSVLALWLLVRPPSVPGDEGIIRPPTPQVTPVPTGQPSRSPGLTPTPAPTGAATPSASPEPTPAPTAAPGPTQYTVQEGDTWLGIAEAFGVDVAELAAVNGLGLDYLLQPGDVIQIPQ